MKKLIIIIVFLGFTYQASTCSCDYVKHFMKQLKFKEYAIVGQLVEITEIDSLAIFGKVGLAGKFKIDQVLKGNIASNEIEITGGTGIDCRENLFGLELNSDYVILLNYDFSLGACGHTILPVENGFVRGKITRKKEQIMTLDQLIEKINRKKNSG